MKTRYCLANLVAGACGGYMNAAGVDFNQILLGLAIGTPAGADGLGAQERIKRENLQLELDNAERQGNGQEELEAKHRSRAMGYMKEVAKSGAVYSASLVIGYVAGYTYQKIIS